MATLVSHPDEVRVISKRFGQGATDIDRYLQLDGYKAVQKALAMGRTTIINEVKNSGLRGRGGAGIQHGDEVVVCSEAIGQAEICALQWGRERARHLQRPADFRTRSALGH
jgi:NADH:ubiquinone oxidoreductase subunit F (NADH-binding)